MVSVVGTKACQAMSGVRLAAICDVDSAVLNRESKKLGRERSQVATYTDIRELLDANDIDAIAVVTPNHWHALATVWACQAGKDVHVEKPISHNLFESRQMVAAARKYKRIVQAGTEARSNVGIRRAAEFLSEGSLGKVLVARAYVYKRRESMGLLNEPKAPPKTVDYNLWCGPAPLAPLMRKEFHYDWHWQWAYGNGTIANNGAHMLDVLRLALGDPAPPTRVMSYGGRFGYDDNGETPNAQVALFEMDSIPVIFECRGLGTKKDDPASDAYRSVGRGGLVMQQGEPSPRPKTGVMIQCEQGYVDFASLKAFDNQGMEIASFGEKPDPYEHDVNFLNAVRSRKAEDLNADILQGHHSVAVSHLGNISYRVGQESSPEEVREIMQGDPDSLETLGRFEEHLRANAVDLTKTPPVLGPWLTFDADAERFRGQHAEEANRYLSREYREPFVVPKEV